MRATGHRGLRPSAKTVHTARRKQGREHRLLVLSNGHQQQGRPRSPFYDSENRELRVGTIVVKRFTQRSDAQEIVLTSFQEEDWCRNIDDPLTVKDDQDAKQRLRRAVDNLNRRQRVPLLRFLVIRQGTGVAWEFLEDKRRQSDGRATLDNGES